MELTIPGLYIAVGSPKSGKTHLCRYIYEKYKEKFFYTIAFTPTVEDYEYLKEEPEKTRIIDITPDNASRKLENTKLNKTLSNLIELAKQKQASKKIICLIIDDGIGCINWSNAIFFQLYTRFRHLNFFILITTQYLYSIPPVLRTCVFGGFLFKQIDSRSTEASYDTFGRSHFKKLRDWEEMLTQKFKKKYQFIFIDKNKENIQEIYRVLKCPEVIKID
jgi:regulator of replication initiation timing